MSYNERKKKKRKGFHCITAAKLMYFFNRKKKKKRKKHSTRLKATLLIEQLEWMALNRKCTKIEVFPRTLSRLSFGVPIYPSYVALHQLTRLLS